MKENNTRIITPLGILLQQDKKINNDIYNDKPKKFERIIISYNFKKNNYYIDNEEIEGYEHKEFLLNTLHNFNNQAIFKFDSPYDPTFCERMIFLIPIIIVFIILIYVLYILAILCTLNPLIFYIAYLCIKKFFGIIKKVRNSFYEKFKKKAINKEIKETNNSDYCKKHNIRFKLGLSGYWLELEKFMGEDNELKNKIMNIE